MQNETVVSKMIDIIEKIQKYVQEYDYNSFCESDIVVEACVFNLGQLGELVNRIDGEYEEAHTEIPWRQIYGLRNRIIHDYEGINLRLIWEIINDDMPELKNKLEELL